MRAPYAMAAAVALSALLAACGGGGGNDTAMPQEPEMPEPGPAPTDFNRFVKDQIAATNDERDAVPVNTLEFRFDDAPGAFDDVL